MIPSDLKALYRLGDGKETRGYLSWGFDRIVACGLEGKGVTWLAAEGARQTLKEEEVAKVLAHELAESLSPDGEVCIDGIDGMIPKDVEGLMRKAQKLIQQHRESDEGDLT